jgi:hypothetical protein
VAPFSRLLVLTRARGLYRLYERPRGPHRAGPDVHPDNTPGHKAGPGDNTRGERVDVPDLQRVAVTSAPPAELV